MKFEDTGLPKNPEVEKAFAAMNAFFGNDKAEHFKESIATAKFLADNLQDKMPGAIGAALIGPAVMMYGADFSKELEGTSALQTLKDYQSVLETPEGKTPAHTKETAVVMLSAIAYAVDDLVERDNDTAQYNMPPGARQHYRDNDLKQALDYMKADAPALIAALKGEETGFVQAFNGKVEAAEKQFASPIPEQKKPAPTTDRPRLGS